MVWTVKICLLIYLTVRVMTSKIQKFTALGALKASNLLLINKF